MQFIYDETCGNENLLVTDDNYKYLIKARRHKVGDIISFRNLNDDILYKYTIETINKKDIYLNLHSQEKNLIESDKKLHLAWCLVDPKTIEKTISALNELGIDKITFIYCEYSQKNFKINFEKLNKILINSSQQSGRSNIIKLDIQNNLEDFIKNNPDSYYLDFSQTYITNSNKNDIKTLIIGCEGGFSQKDRTLFDTSKIVGFNSKTILRSETAIISASSQILL